MSVTIELVISRVRNGWVLSQDLVRSMRPLHYIKNGFVGLPVFFGAQLFDVAILTDLVTTIVAFSLAASGVYIINDITDAETDLLHPGKMQRPIASRRLSKNVALPFAIALLAAGLGAGYFVHHYIGGLLLVYVVLNFFYSTVGKRVPILDVMVVAFGFVLRVITGAIVSGLPPSHWIILATFFLALFITFGRRKGEILLLEEMSHSHRAVTKGYSIEFVDQALAVLAGTVILLYTLYALSDQTIDHIGSIGMVYTVPFVVYGILRYLYLFQGREIMVADNPTDLIMVDKPLRNCIMLWVLTSLFVVYGVPLLKGKS